MYTSCSVSSFLSDYIKQYDTITITHSKLLIDLLKKKLLTSAFSTKWENTDGCSEQYRRASELYLMSVMLQCYTIIIDRGISAPGHGKEVFDSLNAIDKHYIYGLMSNVQLPGSICFD